MGLSLCIEGDVSNTDNIVRRLLQKLQYEMKLLFAFKKRRIPRIFAFELKRGRPAKSLTLIRLTKILRNDKLHQGVYRTRRCVSE